MIVVAMIHPNRTLLGELLWAPWSLVGLVFTLSWMGFLTISSLPVHPFRRFERFQHIYPQPQVAWPLWLLFNPLKVTYDPRYKKTRGVMFAHNHVTMLDANIACGTIPVPICGLENASHLRVPGYGWLLTLSNAIPVHKGAGRFRKIATAFRERKSRGISVLTFPEAHRTVDGKLRKFKRGVFIAARDAGMPIVPIAARGAYHMLPKGAFTMRPGRIETYVAPEIQTEGLRDDQIPALMERVHTVMEAWLERGEMLGHLCLEPFDDPPKAEDEAEAEGQAEVEGRAKAEAVVETQSSVG